MTRPAAPNLPSLAPRAAVGLAIVIALGVAYFAAFYAVRMPTVEDQLARAVPAEANTDSTNSADAAPQATQPVWRRVSVLQFLLFPELLTQRWFGTGAVGIADRIPIVFLTAVILGYATVLGWWLMALCRLTNDLTRLETAVFAVGVGLNLVGTYVLAAGLLGGLSNVLVLAVPAALTLAAAGRYYWRHALLAPTPNSPTPAPQLSNTTSDWLDPRWLWAAVPFALMFLLGGMLPPVEFDVREYHLQAAKEFYQQGQITFLPHNVYANMPLGASMWSLAAMEILGDWWLGALVGKTIVALLAPLTALGLFAAGRRLAGTTSGVIAALVYLSTPWIYRVSTDGQIDAVVGFYLFLAVYATLLWSRDSNGSDRRLLLAGYLAGGSVACKYPPMLFVVIPLTGWILVRRWRQIQDNQRPTQDESSDASPHKPDWQRLAVPCGLFLLAVLLGSGLWFAKNWMLAGNPTYPLLYEVFSGQSWTAAQNAQWNHVHRPHDFSLWLLVKDLARVVLTSEWLSPLLFPLAVLSLATTKHRRLALGLWLYFGFVVATWWLLTHRIDRFWIPALSIVALLAGLGATWRNDRPWRVAVRAFLVLGLALNLLTCTALAGRYSAWFVPLETLRHDPLRVDAWHEYFNRHADDGRVLVVGDAEVFDFEVPIDYNTCFDDSLLETLAKDRTPEQVREALLKRGIAYVYVDWGEIDRYRRTKYGYTDFVQPEVIDRLVAAGVLKPLPPIKGHPGRGYRVVR